MPTLPVVKSLPANKANGWRTLTSVEGHGRLKGIGVVHTQNDVSDVKITLDGSKLVQSKIGSATGACGNNGINIDLPFQNGLEVKIRDRNKARPHTRFWVSYIIGDDDNHFK